jgi:hypothetical protein
MILRTTVPLPAGAPQWRPSSPTAAVDSCPAGTIRKTSPTVDLRLQRAAEALLEQTRAEINASTSVTTPRRLHPLGHRRLRVEESRRDDLVRDLVSDLARGRAMREFQYRYERRFCKRKWPWMAELWALISENPELKFCPSLDRCFKRVLFRSSRYSARARGHPVQRVSLEELLHVVARNFRGSGGNGPDSPTIKRKNNNNNNNNNNNYEDSDRDEDGNNGSPAAAVSSGKHRGRTRREILVQNILSVIERLFDVFDVYKTGDDDYAIEENNEAFAASRPDGASSAFAHAAAVAARHTTKGSASDISTSYVDPRELLCALRVISHPGIDAAEPYLRYCFDLYAHTWSELDERGEAKGSTPSADLHGSIWGATSATSGLATGVEPSFPLQAGSTLPTSNDTLSKDAAMPTVAASLLLSGFASVTTEDEYVPWREWQMACVVTATNDWELELLSGLATRAFLGPLEVDVPQAATLDAMLRKDDPRWRGNDNIDDGGDDYISDHGEFDAFDEGLGMDERDELRRLRRLRQAQQRNRKRKFVRGKGLPHLSGTSLRAGEIPMSGGSSLLSSSSALLHSKSEKSSRDRSRAEEEFAAATAEFGNGGDDAVSGADDSVFHDGSTSSSSSSSSTPPPKHQGLRFILGHQLQSLAYPQLESRVTYGFTHVPPAVAFATMIEYATVSMLDESFPTRPSVFESKYISIMYSSNSCSGVTLNIELFPKSTSSI